MHFDLPRLTIALVLVPTAALAHSGTGSASGFVHGLTHPAGGLDHVLAMLAVGLLAYQLGGRALWLVPASFMTAMALGGALGAAGVGLPHVEIGIALSIVVLGAIIALGSNSTLGIAIGIAGLFAVFHGHAHGTEMPHDAPGAAYAAGFLVATALLHLSGIALGFLIARLGRIPLRLGGGLVSIAGFAILAGMI
jgi:urease accessory protein